MPELAPLITAADLPDAEDGADLAEAVTAIVRDYCGWHVAPSWSETVTLDGPTGGRLVALPSLLVTDVGPVLVDGVAVTDYEWSARGHLRRYGGWPSTFRSIDVTFEHGWPEVPGAVRRACVAIARRHLVNPDGLRSEAGPGYSAVYTVPATGEVLDLSVSKVHEAVLGRYKLPGSP